MPHIIFFVISWVSLFVFIGRKRIMELIRGGIIGGVFAGIVDYFAGTFGFYRYEKMALPIMGRVSIFSILALIALTIFYLNWLPNDWYRRFAYTVYCSSIFLLIDAVYYQLGVLVYMNWQLWYSFILNFVGLNFVAFLSDKVMVKYSMG